MRNTKISPNFEFIWFTLDAVNGRVVWTFDIFDKSRKKVISLNDIMITSYMLLTFLRCQLNAINIVLRRQSISAYVYPTALQHWNSMPLQVSVPVFNLSLNLCSIYPRYSTREKVQQRVGSVRCSPCRDWNLLVVVVGIWRFPWWGLTILGMRLL